MSDQSFFRLNGTGPEGQGLQRRPPYPREGLETDPPVHSSYLYVDDSQRGIKIGAWECTPHTSKMHAFPVNEFMILLEGSVEIEERNGRSSAFRAGEAFLIPKGLVCRWRQSEDVRKFFAIYNSEMHPAEEFAGRLRAIRVPVHGSEGERISATTDASGDRSDRSEVDYTDISGNYAVSTSVDIGALLGEMQSRLRLVHVTSGSLTLSGANGSKEVFEAGDTVLIPPGAKVSAESTDDLRTVSCTIRHDERAAVPEAA